jgi:hypothetical protein
MKSMAGVYMSTGDAGLYEYEAKSSGPWKTGLRQASIRDDGATTRVAR